MEVRARGTVGTVAHTHHSPRWQYTVTQACTNGSDPLPRTCWLKADARVAWHTGQRHGRDVHVVPGVGGPGLERLAVRRRSAGVRLGVVLAARHAARHGRRRLPRWCAACPASAAAAAAAAAVALAAGPQQATRQHARGRAAGAVRPRAQPAAQRAAVVAAVANRGGGRAAGERAPGRGEGGAAKRCQILPLPICRYRFKFQSNLVWDSIKSISNFCFQFNENFK
jgi:hypothetical protein